MKRRLVLIVLSSILLFISSMALVECSYKVTGIQAEDEPTTGQMYREGKKIFRYETFGDEIFWTDKLQLHKAIADSKHGGNGAGLTPKAALDAGLKVDLVVLPEFLKQKI